MWLVQADQDIGPVPCFIQAKAEDPVCVRHGAAPSRPAQTRVSGQALLTLTGAERHDTGTGPGGRDAIQGLPTSMQATPAESKGKRPGLRLRTENHPAGNEIGFRCLLGARVPSQAQPPVQPVPRNSPLSRLALSRLALSRLALSRLALSRLALSRLALSRLALSRLALLRQALSRLALLRQALSRLALLRQALPRLALRRLDATPRPGAGQIITGQLPSGRPARCWTVCRNLPRIRAMSTPEIVTLRISERGRPARITDI